MWSLWEKEVEQQLLALLLNIPLLDRRSRYLSHSGCMWKKAASLTTITLSKQRRPPTYLAGLYNTSLGHCHKETDYGAFWNLWLYRCTKRELMWLPVFQLPSGLWEQEKTKRVASCMNRKAETTEVENWGLNEILMKNCSMWLPQGK